MNTTYKIECWGASGGNYDDGTGIGGKGGYSKGIGYILENTIISICVGGIGRFNGYNGGGDPNNILGGGGATHIAQNNRGTLKDYINNKDEVYIVAGGGGGCDTRGIGGYGGGENGGDGIGGGDEGSSYIGTGGTQSTGGTGGNSGVFGRGGNSFLAANKDNGGGGGGGWYGGGGSKNVASPGGGGSGHINTTLITNGTTIAGNQTFPSPNGGTEIGHEGNGYAIISWISPSL